MAMPARTPRPRRTLQPPPRPWTRADLARLPDDGNRYEVLDGALLVTPQAAFEHQRVATQILLVLATYCRSHGLGVVVAPGAVPHGKSELQPDVQVIPGNPPKGAKWTALPRPVLVVEVLSDSTARRDLGIKRDAYLRWGIPTYWAVDLATHRVTVFDASAPEGREISDALVWQPHASCPAIQLPVAELFV
jgi:Uma2 family endonuclease